MPTAFRGACRLLARPSAEMLKTRLDADCPIADHSATESSRAVSRGAQMHGKIDARCRQGGLA
jgi:hypothetical protein